MDLSQIDLINSSVAVLIVSELFPQFATLTCNQPNQLSVQMQTGNNSISGTIDSSWSTSMDANGIYLTVPLAQCTATINGTEYSTNGDTWSVTFSMSLKRNSNTGTISYNFSTAQTVSAMSPAPQEFTSQADWNEYCTILQSFICQDGEWQIAVFDTSTPLTCQSYHKMTAGPWTWASFTDAGDTVWLVVAGTSSTDFIDDFSGFTVDPESCWVIVGSQASHDIVKCFPQRVGAMYLLPQQTASGTIQWNGLTCVDGVAPQPIQNDFNVVQQTGIIGSCPLWLNTVGAWLWSSNAAYVGASGTSALYQFADLSADNFYQQVVIEGEAQVWATYGVEGGPGWRCPGGLFPWNATYGLAVLDATGAIGFNAMPCSSFPSAPTAEVGGGVGFDWSDLSATDQQGMAGLPAYISQAVSPDITNTLCGANPANFSYWLLPGGSMYAFSNPGLSQKLALVVGLSLSESVIHRT